MVCAPLPALRRCSVQIIGGAAGLPQILEGGANLHMYPCREAEQSSSRRSYAKPAGEASLTAARRDITNPPEGKNLRVDFLFFRRHCKKGHSMSVL